MQKEIAVSVLDLGVVVEGQNISDALGEIVNTALHIEKLGYKRMWLAEHHNMPSVSTAATAVLIGHIAGKTTTLRVGAAGIMLPNHTPLAVAEQFGTLDLLYPDRIDLGLGRAPGTDQLTAAALRRNNMARQNDFPEDIKALQQFLSAENTNAKVRAFPGEGQQVPLWILGSSTDSAYLAAELGLPYAFASHFAPAQLFEAIAIYRKNFKPSIYHDKPYLMVGANVVIADTDEEAAFLQTSLLQMVLTIITGKRNKLQPPVKELPPIFSLPDVQQALRQFSAYAFAGDKTSVGAKLDEFITQTGADELFVTNYVYDKTAKLKSYELLASVMGLSKTVNEIRL
ncbi:MAG: LLM class flavin-dependent oxidoreductase [Bacteroidota bacterium]